MNCKISNHNNFQFTVNLETNKSNEGRNKESQLTTNNINICNNEEKSMQYIYIYLNIQYFIAYKYCNFKHTLFRCVVKSTTLQITKINIIYSVSQPACRWTRAVMQSITSRRRREVSALSVRGYFSY
jgi:hypothetical protein